MFADSGHLIPHATSRRQFLRLSGLRKAPGYVRAGFKSEPLFLKNDILLWFRQTYGTLVPAYVDLIEKEGFNVKPFSHQGGRI